MQSAAPDHQILERMDFLARRHFKEKERRENEHEKEHAVFDRAFDVAIRVEDRQELRAEKRRGNRAGVKALVPTAALPLLGIIAAVIRDLPFRIESIRAHRSFGRQKRAAKSRIGPVRFQRGLVLHAERREKDSAAPVEIEREWKIPPARSSALSPFERRRRAGRVTGEFANPAATAALFRPQSSTSASRVPRKSLTAIVTRASFHCTSLGSILRAPKSGGANLPVNVTCARKTAAS